MTKQNTAVKKPHTNKYLNTLNTPIRSNELLTITFTFQIIMKYPLLKKTTSHLGTKKEKKLEKYFNSYFSNKQTYTCEY